MKPGGQALVYVWALATEMVAANAAADLEKRMLTYVKTQVVILVRKGRKHS